MCPKHCGSHDIKASFPGCWEQNRHRLITGCPEWFSPPKFLELQKHRFLGRDGLQESPPMFSFVQFRCPTFTFFSHKQFSVFASFLQLIRLQSRFLRKNIVRGDGIGQNWAQGVIPTTHPVLKISVSITLEILEVKTTLGTL